MYAAVPRITSCIVAAMLNVGELIGLGVFVSPANAFANPKSGTLTSFGSHLHVGGLQVAVDGAFLVRGSERFRDLFCDSPVWLSVARSDPRLSENRLPLL
jgi:hypothetical protein